MFKSYLKIFLFDVSFLLTSSFSPWRLSIPWLPIVIQLLAIGGEYTLMQKAGSQNQNRTAPLSRLNSFVSLVQKEVKTTVVVPRKHKFGSGILFPKCESGYASHPSVTHWNNSSTTRHYILIKHRTFISQKKAWIPFAFCCERGHRSHKCVIRCTLHF